MERLAADHEELIHPEDRGRSPNRVLELCPLHFDSSFRND
jgi:hypothetical protein